MEIKSEEIKFEVHMWETSYVIKSKFGHYLWKDGLIHNDVTDNNGCWDSRLDAENFLTNWNSQHEFHRKEVLVLV